MSARPLAPGVPAPDFALAATTSGREVRSGSGRPLVLVTYARNVAFAGDRLNRDVRERYSPSGELTVASVVDLSLMPRSSGPARMALDMSYRQAAASYATRGRPGGLRRDPGGPDRPRPRDYDASGAYLVLVVVVIAEHGTVLGHHSGAALAASTLELLQTP